MHVRPAMPPIQVSKAQAHGPWHLLAQYAYLQMMDLLSTLAFLLSGVEEGNPIIRWTIRAAGDPLWGLIWVKFFALGLGVFCLWKRRVRLLQRATLFFALLVTWNLVSLILGLLARAH